MNQAKIFRVGLGKNNNHALFMTIIATWVALIEQMKIAACTVYLFEVRNGIDTVLISKYL